MRLSSLCAELTMFCVNLFELVNQVCCRSVYRQIRSHSRSSILKCTQKARVDRITVACCNTSMKFIDQINLRQFFSHVSKGNSRLQQLPNIPYFGLRYLGYYFNWGQPRQLSVNIHIPTSRDNEIDISFFLKDSNVPSRGYNINEENTQWRKNKSTPKKCGQSTDFLNHNFVEILCSVRFFNQFFVSAQSRMLIVFFFRKSATQRLRAQYPTK